MIDLRSIASRFSFDPDTPFPAFPEPAEGHGKEQTTDINSTSRVSRVSRDGNNDLGKKEGHEPIYDDSEKGVARVEGYAGELGNPGNPGNTSKVNALPFLLEDLKTGKAGNGIPAGRQPPHPPPGQAPAPGPDTHTFHRRVPQSFTADVEDWRDRFYALNSAKPACPGFRASEWPAVFDATHAFLEQHAEAAHALGWTAAELFGVHHTVGAARVDCCGALMVSSGHLVTAVDADAITFGGSRFFRGPASPETILVWDFRAAT